MDQVAEFVLDVHNRLFDQHDRTVLETELAEDFVEHSPLVAGDAQGLATLVEECGEGLRHRNSRVLSDGDLVALHGSFVGLDETELVGFDIYRVRDGKIVEHWDTLVPRQEPNASGRTQLAGPIEVIDRERTEANRELVTDFFIRTLIGGDYEGFREFTRDGVFLQHSPDIADGVEAVVDFLEDLRTSGEGLVYDRTHRTIADGQFVLTHSEGSINGKRHSYCELWRVEDGAIVELWDAIAEVPSDLDAVHSRGVF